MGLILKSGKRMSLKIRPIKTWSKLKKSDRKIKNKTYPLAGSDSLDFQIRQANLV